MKFHPFAEIFPLIDDADFDALVDDIKTHGLREKIWTYEGQILDGRNRFMACLAAKVEPEFREYEGDDALAFVVSLNVQRRHLTAGQRAMAAAEIANLDKGAHKSNAHKCAAVLSQDDAADKFKVSRRSVQNAKQIIDHGSAALRNAVKSGEVPITRAAKVVDLPKPQQLKAAQQKHEPEREPDSEAPERPDDIDEDAALEAAHTEYLRSAEKALGTDAVTEIKRLTAELAVVKSSRDGYMNGKAAVTEMLKAEQRKTARQAKEIDRLKAELEKAIGRAA